MMFINEDAHTAASTLLPTNTVRSAHWVTVHEWTSRKGDCARRISHLFGTGPFCPQQASSTGSGCARRITPTSEPGLGCARRIAHNQDAQAKPEGDALSTESILGCVRQRRLLQPWLELHESVTLPLPHSSFHAVIESSHCFKSTHVAGDAHGA